jgi:3-hydroxyisobutyrate dehydrogenase/glyoxylate/succinic semialdehyde reductase
MGIIGSRAADCLSAAGHRVSTWNRTPIERPDFCNTPVACVEGADFISLYLKDGDAVRDVFGKIKTSLGDNQILLNHSTIDLETTHWLDSQCQETGCKFLEAPFTGSKVAASQAALVYYAGGDAETLGLAREILQATSKEIKHLGPVGSATVVKLATNLISASTVQALSEALALVQYYGIDAEEFTESVASNACGSPLANMKLPCMAKGDYDTHFSLENMLKDSRFALELARSAGIDAPITQVTSNMMKNRCEKGDAQLDFCSLFKAYE